MTRHKSDISDTKRQCRNEYSLFIESEFTGGVTLDVIDYKACKLE